MTKRLRILHIITRMNVGGAGGFVLDMCRLLPADRFECLIVSGVEPEYEGSLEPLCREAGVPLMRAPDLVRSPHPLNDVRACSHLHRIISRWHPDIIHTHTAKAGLLGRWVAHRRGLPAVHHIHGWTFPHQRPEIARRLFRWMEARAATWSAKLLAVSQRDVESGLAAGIGRRKQYAIVRAGIDVSAVRSAAARPDSELIAWKGDRPLVAFIGRLSAQKDPVTFVRAMHLLCESPRPPKFLIVGDGPLAPEVEAMIHEGPGRRHLCRLGFSGRLALLGAVDVLLHPSTHEGLPRMLLEAFAAEVAVVGTDVGGCAEVLKDQVSGLVIPTHSPGKARDAVERILSDAEFAQELRRGAQPLLAEFDIHANARALARVYNSVSGMAAQE